MDLELEWQLNWQEKKIPGTAVGGTCKTENVSLTGLENTLHRKTSAFLNSADFERPLMKLESKTEDFQIHAIFASRVL